MTNSRFGQRSRSSRKIRPPRFVNQARRPGLGGPGRVELPLQEKCELVGVGDGKDLNVAAFFPRLQAVGTQPGTQRHVLRIALLRRGDFFAVKIRNLLYPRALPHNERCPAARSSGNHANRLALRPDVTRHRGIRADVREVNRIGKHRFDRGRPGVECFPFDLHAGTESLLKLAACAPHECLGVRNIGEIPDAQDQGFLLCARGARREMNRCQENNRGPLSCEPIARKPPRFKDFAHEIWPAQRPQNKNPTASIVPAVGF